VLAQNEPDFEHLVFDNCSTDGSLEVLRKYPHVRWVSEADRGQSDALNKGFAAARGQVICWLNSDDAYAPGAFQIVRRELLERRRPVIFGSAREHYFDGRPPRVQEPRFARREDLLRWWDKTVSVLQPAVFFTREVYQRIGGLREDLHIVMDLEYWWRMAEHFPFHRVDEILAVQHRQPESKTMKLVYRMYREKQAVFGRFAAAAGGLPLSHAARGASGACVAFSAARAICRCIGSTDGALLPRPKPAGESGAALSPRLAESHSPRFVRAMTPPQIIGIMLVKNEDRFLRRAVTNILEFCDRILIADHQSTDGTFEIAQELSRTSAKVEPHRIRDPRESSEMLTPFVSTATWVFGVDGDEIYDVAGLGEIRSELARGLWREWWVVFGNVLNCDTIDEQQRTASGWLAPPCRSMTKLYNFAAVQRLDPDSPQRLMGERTPSTPATTSRCATSCTSRSRGKRRGSAACTRAFSRGAASKRPRNEPAKTSPSCASILPLPCCGGSPPASPAGPPSRSGRMKNTAAANT
jgi:glycosyltransferase involved in cell wall biosynthesis